MEVMTASIELSAALRIHVKNIVQPKLNNKLIFLTPQVF